MASVVDEVPWIILVPLVVLAVASVAIHLWLDFWILGKISDFVGRRVDRVQFRLAKRRAYRLPKR